MYPTATAVTTAATGKSARPKLGLSAIAFDVVDAVESEDVVT